MSRTYFIRHSSKLDVDAATTDSLWSEDRIAIHFPHDEVTDFAKGDSRSINPSDYKGRARGAVNRLVKLARDGGFVFATYRGKSGGKVGYVEPSSKITLVSGTWGRQNGHEGREAILKSVRLCKVHNLSSTEAISFTAVQPRQGTFCEWGKIGQRVASVVLEDPGMALGYLTPELQEVMCMEYLRSNCAKRHGLPSIKYTLTPVGRTMKDIDILGLSDDGSIVSAQVTYKTFNEDKRKFRKLEPYLGEQGRTIYFCQCDEHQSVNGHHVFPLHVVFQEFCEENPDGKLWFERATKG